MDWFGLELCFNDFIELAGANFRIADDATMTTMKIMATWVHLWGGIGLQCRPRHINFTHPSHLCKRVFFLNYLKTITLGRYNAAKVSKHHTNWSNSWILLLATLRGMSALRAQFGSIGNYLKVHRSRARTMLTEIHKLNRHALWDALGLNG